MPPGIEKANKSVEETNGKPPKRPGLFERISSTAKAIRRSFSHRPERPRQPKNAVPPETTTLLEDIKSLGFEDLETLLDFMSAAVNGVQDDNELLLERLVSLLAKLPPTSQEGKQLEGGLIHQLWESLDHPPAHTLHMKYMFREADGSNNNLQFPLMGAANTPYVRTTKPMVYQNPNLPDPNEIFDLLMARGDSWKPHPNKISSVLFYLATIIIHDVFQTVRRDLFKSNKYLKTSTLISS
jgi:linoleate 8R-lipoxygenase / 9,12-octadecadienoate 8-hydroperoxide 8S-isomerase